VFPFLNFIRLFLLFILACALAILNKPRAVSFFLKFAGPSFIKLGQSLSVRPDLVGENLANILSAFQDRLEPFSQKKLKKILNQEFGDNFDKIFSEFNYNSIASASIAQVHKAKLRDGNIDVAVKVLRPNIAKIMKRDIKTLKMIIFIVKIFSKFLAQSLQDIADLLENVALSELDLTIEAANGSCLKENLADLEGFYIPKIYWKYCSNKILVLEFLDGIAFSNKEELLKTTFDKDKIAKNFVISYFHQVYVDGFFHADMHLGNLFLLKNGDIGLIDFGIIGKLDKKTRINVAEILMAFLNKDYTRVAKLHVEGDLVPRDTKIEDLAISCRRIGESIVGLDVADVSIAKLLANLIEMTKQYNMKTRPELLLLQKTVLLVEGVGVMLNPKLNIWNLARPWTQDWARKNIGFDAKIRDFILEGIDILKNISKNLK